MPEWRNKWTKMSSRISSIYILLIALTKRDTGVRVIKRFGLEDEFFSRVAIEKQ